MKPSELELLVGRHVELFWHGLRTGKCVRIVATDTITVRLFAPYGSRRVDVSTLRGVFWRGKLIPVQEFLERKKS